MVSTQRRVVITGMGLISPLGSTKQSLWDAICSGRSGVGPLTIVPPQTLPVAVAAEAKQFTGEIENFGDLEKEQKKAIRKGLKVMCRECQMGVAAAQLALADAGIVPGKVDPDRTGVSFASDYMLSIPEEFAEGIAKCIDDQGIFRMPQWGGAGLGQMSPLWLLKYLPNMPASHVAIYNDFRGPNNSVTLREAGANLAVGEAFQIILRGNADAILCGATGTRLHSMKAVHSIQQEEVSTGEGDPAQVSRPFDLGRTGMVLGEGAAAVMLEELGHAQARGATIFGEVVAAASSSASGPHLVARRDQALGNVLRSVLRSSAMPLDEVGHVEAHGLSTRTCDEDEARAIHEVFAGRSRPIPVSATKSYFGNLGAGSGMVELIAGLLALEHGRLAPVLNYTTPDPACSVAVVTDPAAPAGPSFVNLSVTPQAQASAVLVRRFV